MPCRIWRMALATVLCAAIARPARPATIETDGKLLVAGIAVAGAGVALAVTAIVLHQKHKTRSITGCVSSGTGQMSISDDNDKRVYTLSGNTGVIKSGNRVTVEGKRKAPVFEVQSLVKDFGGCQP